jgi:hypothetical protein
MYKRPPGQRSTNDAPVEELDPPPQEPVEPEMRTIQVDMSGKDDVSVWNPDSARESIQETAENINSSFSDDKENPKDARANASKVSVAPGSASKTGSLAGTKRKLLSISSQNRTMMSGGQPILGVSKKKNTGFSIPSLNNKHK